MAKRGIDVGNYSLKVAEGNINIKSLIAKEENILGSKYILEYEDRKYVIGEGNFETELNKSNKENFLPLLLTGLALSSDEMFYQVVCGLPINQFKSNREALENMVLSNKVKEIKLNGEIRKIIITDFKVYPEGVGAYYSLNTTDDVIIIDIGGRTTDIAYILDKKLKLSSTVAVGTLNIYKDIADKLNSKYSVDLDIQMIDRIIDRGYLNIDGESIDLGFITDILKTNFIKINEDLNMKFPARSENIILVGGGSKLFEKAFRKRYKNCDVADDPVFANAKGFQRVAENVF